MDHKTIWLGEEVIRQGLTDVGTVKLQSHEHDAGPDHDAPIDLPDQFVFFPPGPSCEGIEAVGVFPEQ
ncbi:hypothetical protein QC763_0049430 [Podospora pseudopauciseta]|uniref:Uncharacterized protein n=2 Tax=Podospora TaxID=5144 RepID=A0ABR0HF64_9PEZI|nr:hypothetical protein QC763_0049430 [Podospora pseudopauciseta]KAK4677845.1 hypothetical protein QC764_0049080 [Podospora pseudoanserina]